MITLNLLLEQEVKLQATGNIIVKQYEEENDNYIILDDVEHEYIPEDNEADFLDFEVTHIYPEDDNLIIEVKER